MTQKPEPVSDAPEPVLPDRVSDITRAGSPRIQPVLVGFVLAAIIGAISVAAFWSH